jgi:hypothetical protein
MEDGAMTSRQNALPTIPHHVVIAAVSLVAFATIGSGPTNRNLLAAGLATEAPAASPPAESRPAEEATPRSSDQPKERKRTYDGPPRDELLPIARRLPA